MPMSDAKRKANKKWNEDNLKQKYDRIQIVVSKGKKEEIEQAAMLAGYKSVSKYIVDSVLDRMQHEQSARSYGNSDPSHGQNNMSLRLPCQP